MQNPYELITIQAVVFGSLVGYSQLRLQNLFGGRLSWQLWFGHIISAWLLGRKQMNQMNIEKKLYKSRGNRLLAGVLGGIGEYAGIDPTILRLAYVFLTIFTGMVLGIIGYVIAMLIVPQPPLAEQVAAKDSETDSNG